MQMPEWVHQVWIAFKLVAPWLTGGLAGSILTYLMNQRSARRKQSRLVVTTQRVDYAIPSQDETLKALRVSYDGEPFDGLLLFQMDVENPSDRTAKSSPFLLVLDSAATIVDKSTSVQPLDRLTMWAPQPTQAGAYAWDSGELKPGDSARLRLLVSPATDVRWSWRGDDDVEVTSYGRDTTPALNRELRNVVAWFAMYVLCGGVPFFAGFAQAGLIVASAPHIVRYLLRWRSLLLAGRTSSVPTIVIAGSTSNVAVSSDASGRSSISIKTADAPEIGVPERQSNSPHAP